MCVVSVNVSQPREVEWRGRTVRTGIFKEPVSSVIRIRRLNIDGDGQADLTVHGGVDKAVYAYPAEHYEFWRARRPGDELTWGAFGENLTTAGLAENTVAVGDRYRFGEALLEVTQPRLPCYKLGVRFDDPSIVKQFAASGRSGFYCRVIEEGNVEAGASIDPVHEDPQRLSIAEVLRVYGADRDNVAALKRALAVRALSESWREYIVERLEKNQA